MRIRLDKWLWQARFFKTRSLATRQVSDGQVRVNSERILKPALNVGPGDVLTFTQGQQVRVVLIEAIGSRRGPAPEAQALYTDLTPEEPAPKPRSGPRPTKRDRRSMEALRKDVTDE